MSLSKDVEKARTLVKRDGYDMSFGELLTIYDRNEFSIQPSYQRLFRWSSSQKSRFIESLLLGIPVPPLFVATNADGHWELVDGLQRVSTLLQFTGRLIKSGLSEEHSKAFVCEGTRLVPSLDGVVYDKKFITSEEIELPPNLRLVIQRARVRMEILESGSDPRARFELFQRLNTGGSPLSEQEVRTSICVSINPALDKRIENMATHKSFVETTKVSDARLERQFNKELVVRFLVLRNCQYKRGVDVHEYLSNGIVDIFQSKEMKWDAEEKVFNSTFDTLLEALGDNCFRRPKAGGYSGNFSLAAFECSTLALSRMIEQKDKAGAKALKNEYVAMWRDETFQKYSGAGVRGTERLSKLVLPHASEYFS